MKHLLPPDNINYERIANTIIDNMSLIACKNTMKQGRGVVVATMAKYVKGVILDAYRMLPPVKEADDLDWADLNYKEKLHRAQHYVDCAARRAKEHAESLASVRDSMFRDTEVNVT